MNATVRQKQHKGDIPFIGLAGFSGVGKTTLLENLLRLFAAQKRRVATLKHAHHRFDIDKEHKDSYRHRKAGAHEVIISSSKRFAHMVEYDDDAPSLTDLIRRFWASDFILVEGFKNENFPKIEIYRAEVSTALLADNDTNIIAIASPLAQITSQRTDVVRLDLDCSEKIADFIIHYIAQYQ